jgi:hypothetical protein
MIGHTKKHGIRDNLFKNPSSLQKTLLFIYIHKTLHEANSLPWSTELYRTFQACQLQSIGQVDSGSDVVRSRK